MTKLIYNQNGEPFWKWDFPQAAAEIPDLFKAAGTARVVKQQGTLVVVKINLLYPAKVVDWTMGWGNGIAINSATHACICAGPEICVKKLPNEGDKKVNLLIDLVLYTFSPDKTVNLHHMRRYLRNFADKMNNTWYYCF